MAATAKARTRTAKARNGKNGTIVPVPKTRRTKPGELTARAKAPPPISLPDLEFQVTNTRTGTTNRHTFANPLVHLINTFNRDNAEFGLIASVVKGGGK